MLKLKLQNYVFKIKYLSRDNFYISWFNLTKDDFASIPKSCKIWIGKIAMECKGGNFSVWLQDGGAYSRRKYYWYHQNTK